MESALHSRSHYNQFGKSFDKTFRMNKILLILLVFITTLSKAQMLLIPLGQSKKVISNSSALWVENKKILQAEPAGNSWLLRGLQEGTSLVQAGNDLYTVHVVSPKSHQALDMINKELKKYIGLKSNVKNGQIIIEGRIYQWREWLNLANFMDISEVDYQFMAANSDQVKTEAQNYFNEKMREENLPMQNINFSKAPEFRISDSNEDISKYQKLLKPFGIKLIKDKTSIDLAPVVKLEMTILEINKNLKRKYGISWPDSFSTQIFPEFTWNTFSAELNALEQNGDAKILASPNLLCRSGQESTFLVGGEFPIKISTKSVKQVIWKNYGISLKFKPKADSSGRMSLAIESEVSSLDSSLSVDGVPALKTNRVSSHFDLSKSELVALSGLIKEDQGQQTEGLPGLSSLPILGSLFGSKNFQNSKTELVIFVKPSVVNFNHDLKPTENNLRHLK